MLRVAEQYSASDTGLQRRANEDSMLARAPLYVVADGMGGAQAGEVASRIAVESFEAGIDDDAPPERALATLAMAANARIHELSRVNAEHAGMGTTLTAVYVGAEEVTIAHVGDSRAYCLRDGGLIRLTDDHSLVDELIRQGRLTPEEAVEHPQRSVITRALGPEGTVEVDTRSFRARHGDIYLLCSDGLTTMIDEEHLAAILLSHPTLSEAGEALIAAANQAGGRDNITVVLLRVEEVGAAAASPDDAHATQASDPVVPEPEVPEPEAPMPAIPNADAGAFDEDELDEMEAGDTAPGALSDDELEPEVAAAEHQIMQSRPVERRAITYADGPVERRLPRRGPPAQTPAEVGRARRRRRRRRVTALLVLLVTVGPIFCVGYLAIQSLYFIGTNNQGLVTLYNGLPYRLPGGITLYTTTYVSGVSASTIPPERRRSLLDHSLRSESNGAAAIRGLELSALE